MLRDSLPAMEGARLEISIPSSFELSEYTVISILSIDFPIKHGSLYASFYVSAWLRDKCSV